MITKVTIEHFKKFDSAEFEISHPLSLFVGPNNGGKTTALQAISLWSFLIQLWQQRKGGGSAKKRTGASVGRNEIHPAPVLDIKDLWTEGRVKKPGAISAFVRLQIILEGVNERGESWDYGVEATFASKEHLHTSPMDIDKPVPSEVGSIFHLPPLSGVQTLEQKIDIGAQLRAIGEGRPGEVLRNLLLSIHETQPTKWKELTTVTREIFGVNLLPIKYNPATDAFISVYYTTVGQPKRGAHKVEIASAGSGFLQFLLIATFLFSHPNSVLLIDEPDSHLHIFLQRAILDWLRAAALKDNSQLLISTHSEVLISGAGVENIVAFFGKQPTMLASSRKGQLVSALGQVSPLEIVNAELTKRIIYVEGDSDISILRSWADTLGHPSKEKLQKAFFKTIGNDLKRASEHFNALHSVIKDIKGFYLRDGDVAKSKESHSPKMTCEYWQLSEIENYLIHPKPLIRFVDKRSGGVESLFSAKARDFANEYLKKSLDNYDNPHNIKPQGENKGSDFLEAFTKAVGIPAGKSDYWEIASLMEKEEVFPEVVEMLDKIDHFLS